MKRTAFNILLLCLPAMLLCSCGGYKKIGALTIVATRNVDIKNEYVLLQKDVYGYGKSRRGEAFQTAIDKAVNELPNGEFLQNVRVFVKKHGSKLKVEGDIWGIPSSGAVATISGTGTVTGISGGTSVISYSVTNSCGTTSATTIITVTALPTAGAISGTATVCAGNTTLLTDGTTGGTWSSGSAGVATVDGSGLVTGVSRGVAIISYTVTN